MSTQDGAKKRGRPSKRDPARIERLLNALRTGNTRRASCLFAGISEDTLATWLGKYADFAEQVAIAEAEAEVAMATTVRKAATERPVTTRKTRTVDGPKGTVTVTEEVTRMEFDWGAAAWWLKKRRPADWGDRNGVIVGGQAKATPNAPQDSTLADLLSEIARNASEKPLPGSETS